ncbi:MAG: hypothetical protein D3924_18420 [Candidatus Electrothrix sp. AR4]|nr:hypothetical protein [Candidatus Electrothrix sp. AR4]
MLEMTGNPPRSREKRVRGILHRTFGYLFFVLFAFTLVVMLVNTGGLRANPPAWETAHIVLAFFLVSLILIKVLYAKHHAQFRTKLILQGSVLFALFIVLTGVTIGYDALSRSGSQCPDFSVMGIKIFSSESGQDVMNRKCSKCHSLERVYLTYKSEKAWSETVKRMVEFDYPNITSSDEQQIVAYLIQQQRRRRSNADRLKIGKSIVSRKCGICHDLDRVFRVDKSRLEWTETVNTMVEIMGVFDFLSEQEKKDIVAFLSSRQGGVKKKISHFGDKSMSLVARKCSAGCHSLDRVFRVDKKQEEWGETVDNMVEMTGDPDFLSEQEKVKIIDFLTNHKQGLQRKDGVHSEESGIVRMRISGKCTDCHEVRALLERKEQGEQGKKEDAGAGE